MRYGTPSVVWGSMRYGTECGLGFYAVWGLFGVVCGMGVVSGPKMGGGDGVRYVFNS